MKTLLLYSENGCKLAQNFINNILRSGLNESSFPCSDVHRAKLITNNDTGRLQSRSNERNDETVLSIKTRTVTDSRNNNAVRKSVYRLNADYKRWTNAKGNVEKLVTMGSPSATAMHHTIWPEVEPSVEEYLQERLQAQVERVLARAGKK